MRDQESAPWRRWMIGGAVILAGCLALYRWYGTADVADGTARRLPVRGQVFVDGLPVEAGSINFVPAVTNRGPTASGKIENGEFQIDAQYGPGPGDYRVVVQAAGSAPGTLSRATTDTGARGGAVPLQKLEQSVMLREGETNKLELRFEGEPAR